MAINVTVGLPGSGKSLYMAYIAERLLRQNKRIYKKTGRVRRIASSMKFSADFEARAGLGTDTSFLVYWSNPFLLHEFRDCDILYDEMGIDLDSQNYALLPPSFKSFLQQHRKLGIDIYGIVLDFGMVDISLRRLTKNLYHARKICGSRDLSATRPDPKYVWGFIQIRTVSRKSYAESPELYQYTDLIGDWIWISKDLTSVFDTTQIFTRSEYPKLRHIERSCDTCPHTHVVHK